VEPAQCIDMVRLVVGFSPIATIVVPIVVVAMVAVVVDVVPMMMVPVIVRLLHEATVDTGVAHRRWRGLRRDST
jgi:hypothetical protein